MTESERAESPEPAENVNPEAQGDRDERPISQFVHEHPGMAIAGGIALGVMVAAILPRRNREFVAEKSSVLADTVSTAGLMLYREALDRAGAAGDGIRNIASWLGHAGSGKDEVLDGSASKNAGGRSGRFDRVGTFAALVQHLRGKSRS